MSKEKAIEKIQYAVMQVASVYACSAIFDEKTKVIEGRQKELEKAIVNLHDALKELEGDMTKFNVVRYWDTYPDGTVATCDTEEEAEKITARYSRKLMNHLTRWAGKTHFEIRDILSSANKLKRYDL